MEAKSLDADLADRRWISQMLGYATVVGVEWCVLTNGDEYRLYDAHAPVDVEDKLFRAVHLADASQTAYTLETLKLLSKEKMAEKQLDVLWNAHFVDRRVKAALENLVQGQDAGLVRLLRRNTSSLTAGEIRSSLKRADMRVDFPAIALPSVGAASAVAKGITSRRRGTRRAAGRRSPTVYSVRLNDLIDAGLVTPPMDLQTTYLGQHLIATVQLGGTVLCNGETYKSLSVAAAMARSGVKGPPKDGRRFYQTNGWTFWKVHDLKTGNMVEIDALRREYLKTHPAKG